MARGAPILLYHRVGPRDGSYMDDYTVSPRTFAAQMRWLARRKWHPVPLADLVGRRLRACPPRAIAITFDDGFECNRAHAWPVLEDLGFPSSTFVVTGRLGLFNDWDDPDVKRYRLLSLDDLCGADTKLMTFHSHSATHPNLKSVAGDPDKLAEELRTPLETLAPIKGAGRLFAYPMGVWSWALKLAVESAGYEAACTCMEGLNTPGTDPFLLRRVSINEVDVDWRLEIKLRTGRDALRWPPERPAFVDEAIEKARWLGGGLIAALR
jgi:peptidoglycan/xylan/chitin deacetylase (PgdA/CDA1 family)